MIANKLGFVNLAPQVIEAGFPSEKRGFCRAKRRFAVSPGVNGCKELQQMVTDGKLSVSKAEEIKGPIGTLNSSIEEASKKLKVDSPFFVGGGNCFQNASN